MSLTCYICHGEVSQKKKKSALNNDQSKMWMTLGEAMEYKEDNVLNVID